MTIQTFDFLDRAVNERLLPMAREVGNALNPPLRQIDTYVEDKWTPPYGWIFSSGDVTSEPYGDIERQTYGVIFRIVEKKSRTGIPGKLEKKHWIWLPTITNYFIGRRRLIYRRDDPPMPEIPGFHELRFIAGNEIDPLDPTGQFGLDFRFDLVFNVSPRFFPGNK